MVAPIKIGNASGFWGDSLRAPAELLQQVPDLDVLTLDFLAEVSMSILARQRRKDPEAGYPRDFVEVVKSLIPYWKEGGRCKLISNSGGLNPTGCAQACQELLKQNQCDWLNLGVVSGDDVLSQVLNQAEESPEAMYLRNMDDGRLIASVKDRLLTANAYIGAAPLVDALSQNADVIVTGRVADPSLTVAACMHHFGWDAQDWNRLAGATIAGHLIECGTQVTGGISTDWLALPGNDQIAFPVVEIHEDGSCIVSKPAGTGGRVTVETVKEQLVYEIGNPDRYLSPDVEVSFLELQVEEVDRDRIRVSGAIGRPAPETLKVSATYQGGYRSAGQLTIYGDRAVTKARHAGANVLEGLKRRGFEYRESLVECIGAGACFPNEQSEETLQTETVMRIAVADDSFEAVKEFSKEFMPLVTCGPPGTTGYADGRPRVQPLFRFWPCLIERNEVQTEVQVLTGESARPEATLNPEYPAEESGELRSSGKNRLPAGPVSRLHDIALARSGDKGIHANIGVIARREEDYPQLLEDLTVERVANYFGIEDHDRLTRYELPNLLAVNFLIRGILSNPLRVDVQGKALGQVLLQMPWEES